ncbi:glycyl radical protein [Thermodesulfobacteriota bacterium]
MSQRIEKLMESVLPREYIICTEIAKLITESYKETEGDPDVIRTAKAQANMLNKMTIFIEDGELIVGNAASKPMAVEVVANSIWKLDGIDGLRKEGWIISEEAETAIASLNEYWKPRNRTQKLMNLFDEERLWPFVQSGWILPPWKSKEEAGQLGNASSGLAFGLGPDVLSVEFGRVINKGSKKVIEEAEEELRNIRYNDPGSLKKAYFLQAAIIAHKAFINYGHRFADLAAQMASKEADPVRKEELETISATCRWIPENPARTFREAIQFVWFLILVLNGSRICRFDQYMYPFYKKDIEEGHITDEEVLELLQCFRIKDMQIFATSASSHREKWSGLAKWHNVAIGGVTPDGKDATNELSYLVLEAARRCQTPHHTITMRVHEDTPDALMLKAIEVVKTGMGMPAFIGDKSYIDYLTSKGVPLELARDYYPIVCIDANVPEGCATVYPMCATTIAFNWFLHNGLDPNTGKQVGPRTGELESFETFEAFMEAFKAQVAYGMSMEVEVRNLLWQMNMDQFPDAFVASWFSDGIKQGKASYERALPFKLYSTMNSVGLVNMADSLAAVKKLVYDEKKVTMKELKAALTANWKDNGYPDIRKLFLDVPKFGNDDDSVDQITRELYQFYADTAATLEGPRLTKDNERQRYNVAAISIGAHQPAGKLTGATPDGRYAGDIMADGSMSPTQGMDTHGPTAVIKSAAKIDQSRFQSTLFNLKFHPTALSSTEDMGKLSSLIKTYFSLGGKHIQFNVTGKETLLDAKKHPEKHRDLIVRVAGYSAYFVQLTDAIQDEVIERTEFEQSA